MSEDSTTEVNFDQIMSSVAELNKQHIAQLFVPSVNDYVNFKPMTVKQQKKIISSSMDAKVQNLSFSNTINDIIIENCLEGKNNIRLTDKILILLQLRIKSVGDTLIINHNDKEYSLDLQSHVESIIEMSKESSPLEFEIQVENLHVKGSVPALKRDTTFNKEFTKTVDRYNESKLNLTDMVGDIYIHEMVKYVDVVKLGDVVIDMDKLEVNQTIEIFENLPMSVSTQIAEKIKDLRKLEVAAIEHGELPDDVQIPVDATLFTTG